MAEDAELPPKIVEDNPIPILESTEAVMDVIDRVVSFLQESPEPSTSNKPNGEMRSDENNALLLKSVFGEAVIVTHEIQSKCDDVHEESQPSSVILQAEVRSEDSSDELSQVTELVRELVDIGCRNAERNFIDESSVLEAAPNNDCPMDSFGLQRNYIPEHLLPSSGSSSSSRSSCSSDDSTDDSSSVGSSDSSSDSDSDDKSLEKNRRDRKPDGNRRRPVRTPGELRLEDLPPIQDLKISVNPSEVKHVGCVLSIVDCLVVVQSLLNTPALNLDTVLFFEDGEPLGQIFDVFGPVIRPLYSVRFNTIEDIKAKNIVIGSSIYYAPTKTEFTTFVFSEQLRRMKGSDASWENNNEPPVKFLDYSDDEQEKLAKASWKNRHRKNDGGDDDRGGGSDDDGSGAVEKPLIKRQVGRPVRRGRGRRGSHQSNIPEATSTAVPIRPTLFQPNSFSRPSPTSNYYGHEQQLRPRAVFNERPWNPFYGPQGPSIPPHPQMFGGHFNRPPPPTPFNRPPPPTPFNQHWPPPLLHQMRPWRSPIVTQPSIASLFSNQTQAGSAELSNATSSLVASSSSSSNILPNPFRNQSNVPDIDSRTIPKADDETRMIPRFPPLGFVPRY